MTVLAIDAGTTGVTALVVSEAGREVARGYREFPQHFPQQGWVEHDPAEIWAATLEATQLALTRLTAARDSDPAISPLSVIGITNQRETAVLWDRSTLAAPRKAIVWQDRRTAGLCLQLREDGNEGRVSALTGLRLDPYFTGTKFTWLALNEPELWAWVRSGQVAIGTVDSYLIARMTGGRRHVTDASNASRTLLFDITTGAWSNELCTLLRVPMSALPEVVPSYGVVDRSDPDSFAGLDLPIAGIAGDQQAALFGQTCFSPGNSKCTYGTGSFILVNTGSDVVRSSDGMLSTVAWQHPDGRLEYALEGGVFVTGAAIQWLRDGLGIIDSAGQAEEIARSVPDSGGVVFVPALTGLGAPHWDPDARGLIIGLTRGSTRAHIVRATLEAIAFQVRDVVDAMVAEAARSGATTWMPVLRVDGGASANGLLLQLQSDQLQVPVERPVVLDTTALGAAFLAGLGTEVWSSTAELTATWSCDVRVEPGPRDDAAYRRWRSAVERSRQWAAI